ncbi:MAG: hypothetical protein IPF41_17385 [Flavobacteriales bacterium]|nr:hypothetical protein [Flavobacteriales bacterium]
MNDNDPVAAVPASMQSPSGTLTNPTMACVAVTLIAEPVVVALIKKRAKVTIAIATGLFFLCASSLSGLGGTNLRSRGRDHLPDGVAQLKMPEGAWAAMDDRLSVLALFFALLGHGTERVHA